MFAAHQGNITAAPPSTPTGSRFCGIDHNLHLPVRCNVDQVR